MKVVVPAGVKHLHFLHLGSSLTAERSNKLIFENEKSRSELIGTCLAVLYEAATCNRKCHGGPHVFESMCGRAYNLAGSAFELTKLGYYDEALNLVRGLGEIHNLVVLSVVDKDSFRKWLDSNKGDRIRDFSPAKVRKLIGKEAPDLLYIDKDWYSDLSENFTHITPQTKPNLHNDERPICGGIFQKSGADRSLAALATVLGMLSMFVCKYFKFDDLFDQISLCLDKGEGVDNETCSDV